MIFPRISGRAGQVVDLDVTFYNNGVPADPFAIRKVEIYKSTVVPHNLVASIAVADPGDPAYPQPVTHELTSVPAGLCGTEPPAGAELPVAGKYHLLYNVPASFEVPDVYFDLWYFYAADPLQYGTGPTAGALDDPAELPLENRCCNRFWLYPDSWFCTDGLQTLNLGFEPLAQQFNTPEVRPLEVGMMPLPLYQYDYNYVTPLLPLLQATVTISTTQYEVLFKDEPMTIGLRQGLYRTNPWVLRYLLDTSKFLKGTYQYQITVKLPDGSTRVSRQYALVIN